MSFVSSDRRTEDVSSSVALGRVESIPFESNHWVSSSLNGRFDERETRERLLQGYVSHWTPIIVKATDDELLPSLSVAVTLVRKRHLFALSPELKDREKVFSFRLLFSLSLSLSLLLVGEKCKLILSSVSFSSKFEQVKFKAGR